MHELMIQNVNYKKNYDTVSITFKNIEFNLIPL